MEEKKFCFANSAFGAQGISPLRRRGGGFAVAPSTPSQRTPLFLGFLCCLRERKVHQLKNFRLKSSNIRRGRRSSPEGDRKALWSLPQERNPCDNQNQHKIIISIRKKSRWTCNLHLLFSHYLTSSQNLSIFPLTTSRLERQKSGFRTSIPTLAATSAIVPEPQERSRRQ